MVEPALLLEKYAFRRVEIEAAKEYSPGETHIFFDSELTGGPQLEDPRHFILTLKVRFGGHPPEINPVYQGEVEIEGHFAASQNCPPEKWREVVMINGASLLYGAVREMVANITSRGPWPQVLLETVSFIDAIVPHDDSSC